MRSLISLSALALPLFILTAACQRPPLPPVGASATLVKRQPVLDTLRVDGGWLLHEREIPNDQARAINRFLRLRYAHPRGVQNIYAAPDGSARWLVVAGTADSASACGLRLVIVEQRDSTLVVTAVSRGLLDADWLALAFFTSRTHTFLLGDTGSESSWGIVAYELTNAGLNELGTVPAVSAPSDPAVGWYETALPYAEAGLTNGALQVEFYREVVHSPGHPGPDVTLPADSSNPAVYSHRHGRFDLVTHGSAGGRRPAT